MVKRGLVFGIVVVGLLVITSLSFASATVSLSSSAGTWEKPLGTDITETTLSFTLDNLSTGGANDVYMHVVGGTGELPIGTSIKFEIYEKDSNEGGTDDSIRVGENAINGSYSGSGEYTGEWIISLADIYKGGIESDDNYEYYYKLTIGNPLAGGSTKTYTGILNIHIVLPTINVDFSNSNFYWLHEGVQIKDLYKVYGPDMLTNTQETGLTNAVAPTVTNVGLSGDPMGLIPVVIEIWSNGGCDQTPVRAGDDALIAYLSGSDTFSTDWFINLDDIRKSLVYPSPNPILTNETYRYWYYISIAGYGVCTGDANELELYVDWASLNGTEKWFDNTGSNEIHSLNISSIDLGSDNSKVYLDVSDIPTIPGGGSGTLGNTEGQKVYFEIYEQDDSGDADGINPNDGIRTIAKGNYLTGTVDASGHVQVPWTITKDDILADPETESSYEYKFNWGFIGSQEGGNFIPVSSGDNSLTLNLDGQPSGCDLTGASGEWVYNTFTYDPIGSTIIGYNSESDEYPTVFPYSFNLNCPQDTPITIEIYEKDTLSDDLVRTVSQGTAIQSTVDASGRVSGSWTVNGNDINLSGGNEGTQSNPYEFYFKIISGGNELSFNNQLLYLANQNNVCPSVSYCGDYQINSSCNLDSCGVANATGLDLYGIDCSVSGTNCACNWSTNSTCEFVWGGGSNPIGTCNYVDDPGNDTCDDDGFLSYTWTGTVTWDSNNNFSTEGDCQTYATGLGGSALDCILGSDSYWHYDPNGLSTTCKDGSNTIICPAKVQLPASNWATWVIIIAVLIIIYIIVIINRNKKEKNSKGKKSKSKKKK